MRRVRTKDNTYTLYSEKYDEAYHSTSGALDESLRKFIEPCQIKDGMNILDIGFGIGYNVGMAMFKAKNLRIISLEKDTEVLKEVQKIEVPYWFRMTYDRIKNIAKNLVFNDNITTVNIILGDASKTIKQILTTREETKFDAVFLDPFSPLKNPELWSTEFLREVYKRMKNNAILATYSCAGVVRRNLKEAGFEVKDGPCVGRRSPGTIALKKP